MKPVVWSPNAIESIRNSYNYIYSKSPHNANLVAETLFDLGEKLGLFPEKNPMEPLLNREDIRFFPKWNFKIVYRIEKNRIYILDVFSTSQNPKNYKF